MTFLLVGAAGWFGGFLRERLPDAVAVSASDVLSTNGRVLEPLLDRPGAVVVNAAGARSGDPETMRRLNAELPGLLVAEVERAAGHLVHLGSAAEYGLGQPGGLCVEDAVPAPESEYGRTKLAGTMRALDGGRATVLRVFNVAAVPPQAGTPLAEVAERVRSAVADDRDVELLSAGTVRDWVRPSFVCASVVQAAQDRAVGVFNVCSGTGVAMGAAVEAALRRLGSLRRVVDLAVYPPTTVIGSADRWRDASGLGEALAVDDLGAILGSAVSGRVHEQQDEDGGHRW